MITADRNAEGLGDLVKPLFRGGVLLVSHPDENFDWEYQGLKSQD